MMSQLTRQNLEHILGQLDGNTLQALQATGANLKDIQAAKDLVDQKSDIVGQGEQVIPGPVRQVVVILQGDQ